MDAKEVYKALGDPRIDQGLLVELIEQYIDSSAREKPDIRYAIVRRIMRNIEIYKDMHSIT